VSDRFQYLEIDEGRVPRRPAAGVPGARCQVPGEDSPSDPGTGGVPAHAAEARGQSEAAGAGPAPGTASEERASFSVIEVIGEHGSAIGEFQSPGGIAVDRLGNLYVADSYNHRVQRITPAGDVAATGERGARPGQFLNPQGIAVDEDLRFYVVEQGNCRVQAFTPHGECLGVWGRPGSGPAELRSPMGIACAPRGQLFVADTGNGRVLRVAREDVQSGVGGRRSMPLVLKHPGFRRPQGVWVDARGALSVADTFSHQILRFDGGMRLQSVVGQPGDAPGQLNEPQDLAVDDAGRLYVVECGSHRLQVFAGEGEEGATSLQCITAAGRAGQLVAPCGVAVAPDGSVYVADTGNHRILRLKASS
jgi:tripartite motif-containing protein 71